MIARALAVAVMLTSAIAFANDAPVETQGQAPVQLGDRLRAKQRAIEEAMRLAVEQAALTLAPELAKRTSELRLRVLPKARTFIASYRIVDEHEIDGIFVVRLLSTVSMTRLASALSPTRAIPLETARPQRATRRLAACLSLRSAGVAATQQQYDSAEAELRRVLEERRIELTSSSSNACDETALLATATAQHADLVLYGLVELKPSGLVRGTSLLGMRAEMTVRLRESTGNVLVQREVAGDAYGADLDAARASAFSRALAQAVTELDSFLGNANSLAPSVGIVVRVLNVRRHADVATVAHALEALSGVQKVEPRAFVAADAELLVTTELSSELLAAALGRATIAGGRLLIEPNGQTQLNVRLVALEATPE